jgi:hypothetical protein
MRARARAEAQRLSYFDQLVRRGIEKWPGDVYQQLLCLEFFRRFQLGVQQAYYKGRRERHLRSRGRSAVIAGVAAAILAFGSGLGGVLAIVDPSLVPLAALGTLGAALSILASRREEIEQDERNAERYKRTSDLLSTLRKSHGDVQRAVAAGNAEPMIKYVAAVHNQLSLEHRQWLENTEEVDSTIRELRESLKPAE